MASASSPSFDANPTTRTGLRDGDVEAIVRLHRVSYEREFGFDSTFAAHVEEPLREFAASPSPRERVWIVDRGGELRGCVAVVEAARAAAREERGGAEGARSGAGATRGARAGDVNAHADVAAHDVANAAQLRWFLVAPDARGAGLGRRLLDEAIEFSRGEGYSSLVLWTVDVLAAAARLYRSAGFEKVESRPTRLWGAALAEEKYAMRLK